MSERLRAAWRATSTSDKPSLRDAAMVFSRQPALQFSNVQLHSCEFEPPGSQTCCGTATSSIRATLPYRFTGVAAAVTAASDGITTAETCLPARQILKTLKQSCPPPRRILKTVSPPRHTAGKSRHSADKYRITTTQDGHTERQVYPPIRRDGHAAVGRDRRARRVVAARSTARQSLLPGHETRYLCALNRALILPHRRRTEGCRCLPTIFHNSSPRQAAENAHSERR